MKQFTPTEAKKLVKNILAEKKKNVTMQGISMFPNNLSLA